MYKNSWFLQNYSNQFDGEVLIGVLAIELDLKLVRIILEKPRIFV